VGCVSTAGILLLTAERSQSMESVSLTSLAFEKLAEAKKLHSGRPAHHPRRHTHELRQTLLALLAATTCRTRQPRRGDTAGVQGHVRVTTGDDAWRARRATTSPFRGAARAASRRGFSESG